VRIIAVFVSVSVCVWVCNT